MNENRESRIENRTVMSCLKGQDKILKDDEKRCPACSKILNKQYFSRTSMDSGIKEEFMYCNGCAWDAR